MKHLLTAALLALASPAVAQDKLTLMLDWFVNPDHAPVVIAQERGFFADLVAFMISGPVVVQVLEGENAIALNRELMGATNPKEAAAGTIRADFAESIDANAVHGSDSEAAAAREIAYFFAATEVTTR